MKSVMNVLCNNQLTAMSMIHRTANVAAVNVLRSSQSQIPARRTFFSLPASTMTASSAIRPQLFNRSYSRVVEGDVISSRSGRAEREEADPGTKLRWTLLGTAAAVGIGTIAMAGKTTAASADDEEMLPEAKHYPTFVRERLQSTYSFVAGGLGVAAGTAMLAFRSGIALRMLSSSPWLVMGVSLVGGMGSLILCHSIPYETNATGKMLAYGSFCAITGLSLSTLGFLGPTILWNAASATGLMVGSISLVAATAPSDQFLWMGGPLAIGLGVVVCASVGQMFFPASSMLMNVALYGGVGLFGAFQLYDVQRIQKLAKTQVEYDPIDQSTKVFLNIINIYIRIAQILASQQRKK